MRRRRGTVLAVCVGEARVHLFAGGREERTAIEKRPTEGHVAVGSEGLAGDTQVDRRFHGGPDRAVYAYAQVDADHWAAALSRAVPPGLFGENLRISGIDVSAAHVGERWRTRRGLVLEVSAPRMPCRTLQGFLDVPDMIARFNAAGRPGAYLRVIDQGEVAVGDRFTVERDATAKEAPSVRDVMAWRHRSATTAQLHALVALEALAVDLRQWASETLADR